MNPWLKRIGVGLLVVLSIVLAFLVFEHWRGRWALNRTLSTLAKTGERLSIAALEPPRPPPAENALTELALITNVLQSIFTNVNRNPPGRFASPGKRIVSWQLPQWRDGKITNDWATVAVELQRAEQILPLIHSATKKPALDSGFDYQKGFVDFQFNLPLQLKQTAQLLVMACGYEHNADRLDRAHEHLTALVRLVNQQSEPLVISQLIRQACAALAFNATWEALQAAECTEAQLKALQDVWKQADFAGDMARAYEMERAMQLDFFNQIKHSPKTLNSVVRQSEAGIFSSFATEGFLLHHVNVPLWRFAWANQDQLRSLKRWQQVITQDRSVREHSWAAVRERAVVNEASEAFPWLGLFSEATWWERFRFLFSAAPFGVSEATIRRTLSAVGQRQLAMTAIALRRFTLRTGDLPSTLNALVPEYIGEVPQDRMDGGTLRYRKLSRDQFLLYSVGYDAQDDGGDPTAHSPTLSYYQIWDGRDAVWPAAATTEEAAAAMSKVAE